LILRKRSGPPLEQLPTCYGTHFTSPGNTASAAPLIKTALERGEIFRAHAFEYACARADIDHRLTKPKHPWTTDVIDKRFLRLFAIPSEGAWATAWQRAGHEAQVPPRCLH